jgi:beta-mannosidase
VRRTISLDGDWERRDFLDEAWRWSDALRPSDAGSDDGPPVQAGVSGGWRAGRVPGSTIDDAWRGGEIPNPYLDRDSLAAEWVPQRTWLYRRRFTVPADAPSHAALRFEGLDPGGTVLLDGTEVAPHDSMFVPLEIDLGGRLAPGSTHDLVVVLDPAPPMPSQVSRTDLARLHRSRMGYGWDFCPRMLNTGIWRSVSLVLRERAWLSAPRIRVSVDHDRRGAIVEAWVNVGGDRRDLELSARLVEVGAETAVDQRSVPVPASGEARLVMDVAEPHSWWPNGCGDPALYRLGLALTERGSVLDERTVRFGIRSLTTEPTRNAPPGSLPYALRVNAWPTSIRGWNWTPIDALYGVPRPDRLRHLVELANRANVNLLRVWGGGLIESDAFYDACDEAGIMIWQEFAQSSSGVGNTPAGDPAFVELMRREAEAIVPLRTHHPSLVLWCGGNELADADGRPLTDAHPVIGALRDVVADADPDRGWLPTSPTGPRFDNSLAAVADDPDSLHDVHGPWEHQGLAEQHTLANATTNLLHSEFGVEGMTNLETLRATVTEPHRWTADRTDPVMAHRGAWWNNEPFVQRQFGGGLTLEQLERASQHLQADGLRTLIEGDRRRRSRCAGTLPWVFNEPFPNAWSNAAVDYFGVPKAAYYAVAEAYAPIAVGTAFPTQALDGAAELEVVGWVVNDLARGLVGRLQLALHDATGRLLGERDSKLEVPAFAASESEPTMLPAPGDAADLLILDAIFRTDDARWQARRLLSRTASLEPMRRLPNADLEASITADGDAWSIRLVATGSAAAVEVRLDDARPVGWPERAGVAYVEANVITLLPGEERAIRVDWHDVPATDRRLRLSGWNVEQRELGRG